MQGVKYLILEEALFVMSSLAQAVKDIITTTSGDAVDLVRINALLGMLVFLGLAIYNVVWQKQPFQPHEFGIGLGAVIAAVGIALKLSPDNSMSPDQLTNIVKHDGDHQ